MCLKIEKKDIKYKCGTVVQQLTLLLHNKKVLVSIPGQDVPVWSLHLLPVPT